MKEILAQIKPSQKEQQHCARSTVTFLSKLTKALLARKLGAKAILGGSGAKGTWLAGSHDIDIFVIFDFKRYAQKSDQLSDVLEPVLKKSFPSQKITRLHGSRDYFQLVFQKLNFEVVPILNITKAEDAVNITDVSPLHSVWVNQHTKGLKEEVLLAKQFCKAQGLYGAESYINGFSGYVLEILIAHYGSFLKLLQASWKGSVKEVIDAGKHYAQKDALFELNQSKLQSPLIVIDPVDKSRNAAAALSMDKFLLMKKKAKEYLAKPGLEFFVPKEMTPAALKKEAEQKRLNGIIIIAAPLSGKKDVVGVKLMKVFEFLQEKLTLFSVKESGWEWEQKKEALLYFFLEKRELPQYEIQAGPPTAMKEFVKDFTRKHKDTYIEKGRIMAKVKREQYQLAGVVKALLKEKYVKERVAKVSKVMVV